ncbi:MAG: cytochrome P450 [Bdellovibrionota bacterium]
MSASKGLRAPGPPARFLVGNLPDRKKAPLRFFFDLYQSYGPVVRFKIGPKTAYLLNHPDYVRHVLQDNVKNYPKGPFYKKAEVVLGKGIVTSEGDTWRRNRKLMQPAFHRTSLQQMSVDLVDCVRQTSERWENFARRGEPIDVLQEMMRLTISTASRCMFGLDIRERADDLSGAVNLLATELNARALSLLSPLTEKLPLPRNIRFNRALRELDSTVYRMIDENRREGATGGNLISMLLQARDEDNGEGMSDKQIRDEVVTSLIAGYETTAISLAWTWYFLSLNPELRKRMEKEVEDALGDRHPSFADLDQLTYTRRVYEESLRLYPPPWVLPREPVERDVIGGYEIEAGSIVILSSFLTHRTAEYWPNPDVFDPDRFAPENSVGRSKFAYFPFSWGPRQCIGLHFAMMEAVLTLSTLSRRFRLELMPEYPVEPEDNVLLRPKNGIRMRVSTRATGV